MIEFLENKYTRWYFSIIENAQKRTEISGYFEKHHIIPKSLGGSNRKDNLVKLTAREHFICHWLLTKMTTGKDKISMAYACKRMMHGIGKNQERYRISSKIYENLKNNLNQTLKERVFTNEWRKKLSESAKARVANESVEIKQFKREKMIKLNKSRKGIKKPYQTGENNPFVREVVKEKIKQSNIEKYGYPNPSLIPWKCDNCQKEGRGLLGYKRWHGINCRCLKNSNKESLCLA